MRHLKMPIDYLATTPQVFHRRVVQVRRTNVTFVDIFHRYMKHRFCRRKVGQRHRINLQFHAQRFCFAALRCHRNDTLINARWSSLGHVNIRPDRLRCPASNPKGRVQFNRDKDIGVGAIVVGTIFPTAFRLAILVQRAAQPLRHQQFLIMVIRQRRTTLVTAGPFTDCPMALGSWASDPRASIRTSVPL